MQTTSLSAVYVGSCEATSIALGEGQSSLMPGSFRKVLLLWNLLLKGDWWMRSSQGRALRTLRKCMNQDSKIWNIENSRIRSFVVLIFIVKDGDVSVLNYDLMAPLPVFPKTLARTSNPPL